LDAIAIPDVMSALKQTIETAGREVSVSDLTRMAEATHGFALMIQLVGYRSWAQGAAKKISSTDVEAGIAAAKLDFEHMMIENTITDISPMDLKFLIAMLPDLGESLLSDIIARTGWDANKTGQHRLRLIRQGIIAPTGRGRLKTVIPRLKEFLKERYT
jgi:hypothetical protein